MQMPELQQVPDPVAAEWGFIHFLVPVMIDSNWHGNNEGCKNHPTACKISSLQISRMQTEHLR